MVEKHGINPWDAMVLAHYVLKANDKTHTVHYNSGRGLLGTLHAPSLFWPRSYDQMVKFFSDYYYINNVWSGKFASETGLIPNNSSESSYANNNGPGSRKYSQEFSDKLSALLLAKKYGKAWEAYRAYCKEFLPLIKCISKNYSDYSTIFGVHFKTIHPGDNVKTGRPLLSDLITHLESI
jgi:hypothetical protein